MASNNKDFTCDLCGRSDAPLGSVVMGHHRDGTHWGFHLCDQCAQNYPFEEPTDEEREAAFDEWFNQLP